jgi:aquaporin Z
MTARALAAEFVGTFTLVAAVCATALFAAPAGGGLLAIALAAGLAVLAMAYAIGHVSGGHFNPAVTLGLVAGGRFDAINAVAYIVAQVAGGLAASAVCAVLLAGAPIGGGAPRWASFLAISNTFGSAGQFGIVPAFLVELVLTALFMIVIMGATGKRASAGFAPVAIGLALALFYLIALPITNASLNPARSTATAVFAGGKALADLWVFWVAPIVGAVIGALLARWLQNE